MPTAPTPSPNPAWKSWEHVKYQQDLVDAVTSKPATPPA
jgi:hypothetical protein